MYNKPQSQEEQQKDRQHEQADGGQESEPQGVVNASKRSAEASRNASPPHPGYFNSDSIEIEHQKNK